MINKACLQQHVQYASKSLAVGFKALNLSTKSGEFRDRQRRLLLAMSATRCHGLPTTSRLGGSWRRWLSRFSLHLHHVPVTVDPAGQWKSLEGLELRCCQGSFWDNGMGLQWLRTLFPHSFFATAHILFCFFLGPLPGVKFQGTLFCSVPQSDCSRYVKNSLRRRFDTFAQVMSPSFRRYVQRLLALGPEAEAFFVGSFGMLENV